MAKLVGFDSLDDLIKSTIPDQIRFAVGKDNVLPAAKSETEALATLRAISLKNKVCFRADVCRSCDGVDFAASFAAVAPVVRPPRPSRRSPYVCLAR